MRYDVYLGEATIYGVSEVEENVGRAIGIHNGLGQGNFVIGGDRELRRFGLSCELGEQNSQNTLNWSPAKNLFGYFERLLEERDPMRLIIVSEHSQISLPVLLESYTKTEAYAGVYAVGIKLIEHRTCAVQSAEVPYVKRPGKMPQVMEEKRTVINPPQGNTNKLAQEDEKRYPSNIPSAEEYQKYYEAYKKDSEAYKKKLAEQMRKEQEEALKRVLET